MNNTSNSASLKNNQFYYVYFGNDSEEEFYKLKEFCGDYVNISYEIASGIGGFWSVSLTDYTGAEVQVCNGSYVVNIGEGRFVAMDPGEFRTTFEENHN